MLSHIQNTSYHLHKVTILETESLYVRWQQLGAGGGESVETLTLIKDADLLTGRVSNMISFSEVLSP